MPRSSSERVGAQAGGGQVAQHQREVAVDEPRVGRRPGGEALEVPLGLGVAVDGDVAAVAAQLRLQQGGVAAGAEGAVDHGVTRLQVEQLGHLGCEDGHVFH